MKLSLIYLRYTRRMRGELQKKCTSRSVKNILDHRGAISLPMPVPFVCRYREGVGNYFSLRVTERVLVSC